MVHFPGFARTRLCIQRAVTWFYQIGFPHSDISGSKPVCGSPKLFAAYRVLHRLLAPRHPPYALSSLTIKLTQHSSLEDPHAREGRVLQALDSIVYGVFRYVFERPEGLRHAPTRHEEASSPFHKTLLSSKIAVLRHAELEIRTTQCLLHSVVKERPFRSSVADQNVSASSGARYRFGADIAKKLATNKKPGDERRANPSIS
jgi:hypothetical protein